LKDKTSNKIETVQSFNKNFLILRATQNHLKRSDLGKSLDSTALPSPAIPRLSLSLAKRALKFSDSTFPHSDTFSLFSLLSRRIQMWTKWNGRSALKTVKFNISFFRKWSLNIGTKGKYHEGQEEKYRNVLRQKKSSVQV
jgi:hypothetical protein